jgi:integrase
MKITNINYRNFLDNGIIKYVELADLTKALNNITGKHIKEGRCLMIVLYYTGCRPIEALRMYSRDITKEKQYLKIRIPAAKKGLPRTMYLNFRGNPLLKELFNYVISMFPDMLIFYNYRNRYIRKLTNKKGIVKEKLEETNKVYYMIKQAFSGVIEGSISPYFLRHNRFSSIMEKGGTESDIKFLKGARSFNSVTPYIHLSTVKSKKIARFIT